MTAADAIRAREDRKAGDLATEPILEPEPAESVAAEAVPDPDPAEDDA